MTSSFKNSAIATLGSELLTVVLRIGEFGSGLSSRCFLIGGGVRDVLLGRATSDVDILVEGNAMAFAHELQRLWGTVFPELAAPNRVDTFARYGTAKLLFTHDILPGLRRLDFASAREEAYPLPAGAPEVTYPTTVGKDLGRRDFSINAMAADVSSGELPLIDPFNGQSDLTHGLLRILHPQSFVDDPARIIRAVRFMARFGFELESETAAAFSRGLAERGIAKLPAQRRFDELRKAFGEPDVERVLDRLDSLGILRELHPGIRFGAAEKEQIRELPAEDAELERGLAVCAVLIAPIGAVARAELLQDSGISKKTREVLARRAARNEARA